jgi:flavin reductase (DIM6/NTAB) family NADH-FMN oxidoreductase RutF
MFHHPAEGHGLPHNPFKAIVSPLPIGRISGCGAEGLDLRAPRSFFNAVARAPPQVMFASTGARADRGDSGDSVARIRKTGVFCADIAEHARRAAMKATAAPRPAGRALHGRVRAARVAGHGALRRRSGVRRPGRGRGHAAASGIHRRVGHL